MMPGGDKLLFELSREMHPAIAEVATYCKCGDSMVWWENHRAKREFRFPFSVCPTCGHTVVFEGMIRAMASGVRFDAGVGNLIGFIHDLTKGSRKAAAKFEKAETVEKAIVASNIRFVSIKDAKTIVDAWNRRQKEQRIASFTPMQKAIISRTGILVERKYTDKREEKKVECRFCAKKFSSTQERHNHRCKYFGGMPYHEVISLKKQGKVVPGGRDGGYSDNPFRR